MALTVETIALAIAALTGVIAALFVHWLSWYIRLKYLSVAVFLGALAAILITLLGALFIWPYPSDIADIVLKALIALWTFAFLVGILQAFSLPAPWWKGVLSIFFEAGLGFLTVVGVNYALQYTPLGRLVDIPFGELLNRFALAFLIVLTALALIRPIVRLVRRR